jgi:DNA adenine methylase
MPRSPITYYGGKLNMLKHILPNSPDHRIYTESYFGGGAVFFAKEPSASEIINDTNAMVVNFYEVCKNDFENLKHKIEATLFSRATYTVAHTMYRMPHLFPQLQLAWAFYVATNMGFSSSIGSWGFDKYGKRVKAFHNKKLQFDGSIFKRLSHAQIEHNDACKVIATYDTNDTFHYIDPPYFNTHQGHYTGYAMVDFERLLTVLSQVQGKFLLSSFPSEILTEYTLKFGWYTKEFSKPLTANKATLGIARTKRKTEVLTANYPIQ